MSGRDPHLTHEFLIDSDEPERPLRVMAELREYVDGLPETAALWSPRDATDAHPHGVPDLMLEMLGAWPAPEYYGNGTTRYVNPAYIHAKKYSDLETTCDCGYRYGYGRGDNVDAGAITAHDETCTEQSRTRAKVSLRIRRIAWLKRAALLWLRQPIARKRLGFSYDEAASRLIRPLPESYFDWYGQGKRLTANTMTILRGRGVDAELIARAYGTSRQTVYTYKAHCDREYVEQRCPGALADHRRKA